MSLITDIHAPGYCLSIHARRTMIRLMQMMYMMCLVNDLNALGSDAAKFSHADSMNI